MLRHALAGIGECLTFCFPSAREVCRAESVFFFFNGAMRVPAGFPCGNSGWNMRVFFKDVFGRAPGYIYSGGYPGIYSGGYPGICSGSYPGIYSGMWGYPGMYSGVLPGCKLWGFTRVHTLGGTRVYTLGAPRCILWGFTRGYTLGGTRVNTLGVPGYILW